MSELTCNKCSKYLETDKYYFNMFNPVMLCDQCRNLVSADSYGWYKPEPNIVKWHNIKCKCEDCESKK